MDPFEKITASEVIKAQEAWVAAVIAQDVESLLALYDFGSPDYPNDDGFLHRGWKRVEFQSEVGPILKAGGLGFKDMGHYAFVNAHGDATRADYTFTYHKIHGDVLISLHHSSLTWVPPKR